MPTTSEEIRKRIARDKERQLKKLRLKYNPPVKCPVCIDGFMTTLDLARHLTNSPPPRQEHYDYVVRITGEHPPV
jgi:hypothetical protein